MGKHIHTQNVHKHTTNYVQTHKYTHKMAMAHKHTNTLTYTRPLPTRKEEPTTHYSSSFIVSSMKKTGKSPSPFQERSRHTVSFTLPLVPTLPHKDTCPPPPPPPPPPPMPCMYNTAVWDSFYLFV